MLKRCTSLLLTVVMLLSMLPTTALAAEEERRASAQNPFAGKTVSILSASTSTYDGVSNNTSDNSTIGNNAVYYTEGRHGVYLKDTWWQQVIDALGMQLLVNNSWSGSCVFQPRRGAASVGYGDRAVNLHNDHTGEEPDIIWVYLGCNDFAYYKDTFGKAADVEYSALIRDNGDGTFTYAAPQTACEAYAVMLHKVQTRYPDAEVYCLTTIGRRDPDYAEDGREDTGQPTEYNAELMEIAAHFECAVIDWEDCIPKEAELFDKYIGDKRAHPNADGMDLMSQAAISGMLGRETTLYDVSGTYTGVDTDNPAAAAIEGMAYQAELTPDRGYSDLDVTVTMDGVDVTRSVYADGTIHIETVTGDIEITAVAYREPKEFRWEVVDDQLVSAGEDQNTLTVLSGTITDGVITGGKYRFAVPVVLKHDRPWVMEWKCGGDWRGPLLSTTLTSGTNGRCYLARTKGGQLCFGTRNGNQSNNYGADLSALDSRPHTYRLENRIADDGSNMVWLYLDGAEIGAMNNYFIASEDQGTTANWLSGRDFVMPYIGLDTTPLDNWALEYLQVWENGENFEEPETETLPHRTVANIGSWQEGAVWNNDLFVLNAKGNGAVYDLETMTKRGEFALDQKDQIVPHANSVCFSNEFYAEGDAYPLLYVNIYNNYASAQDRMEGTCCVYRIIEANGTFSAELVQIIRLGFTEDLELWKSKPNNEDARPYGNFVVDRDQNKLYAFVMRDANKTTRFFRFNLPDVSAGAYNEVYGCQDVTLEEADIEEQFDVEYFRYMQGCCYFGGKIISAEGFGASTSAKPALRVIDLESQMLEQTYDLAESGLTAEPEVIAVNPTDGILYYAAADGVLRMIDIPELPAVPERKTLSLRYDDRYDVTGKTVEIIDAGKPTSYQVGYGVAENAVRDTAVVTLKGDTLVAAGIGTAQVKIDGEAYTVVVESAPISLLLLAGQSNMRGSEGDEKQSIVCPDGMVYATYGDDRGASNTAMTEANAHLFAPSALAGNYSTVNVAGTTECLSGYPVNSLTEAGVGKIGPDSGFAYEWVQQTGEKVWVVNAAHGGTSISVWQENTTEYEQCKALFTACQETLRKEIAAGHYTLSHMAYFWCQGCSDRGKTAEWYVDKYLAMHDAFKSELAFDHDSDPTTADKTFEFGGIIPVRVGSTAASYRDGVNSDKDTYSYHESFVDLRMSGPRVAQYWMGNNPELEDIWNVCTIGEDWVWMPDGTNGVADYFRKHYPGGTVDYTTQVAQKASWYTPTTPKAVHDSIHYNQIGYNELGRESVRNALIMLGELEDYDEATTVEFVNWTGYQPVNSISASTTGQSGTLVVPMVSPITRCKDVTYAVSDGLTYKYYDLLAKSGETTGTLTAKGANAASVSVVKQQPGLLYADHLSRLPQQLCCGLNLWSVLEHDPLFYSSGTHWGTHSSGTVYSVTIPVQPGDKVYATAFGKAGENGHATTNGIRCTFFGEYDVVKTLDPAGTYAEFRANGGYLVAPEGATAINIPMWTNDDSNEIYILNRTHDQTGELCSICGKSSHEHSWSAWKTVSLPTAAAQGVEQRTCTCGETQERKVDGVWQKYALADHLSQLPANTCCDTNLWAVLEHDKKYFASGTNWAVYSGGDVCSVTIPVTAGERIYASSWGKAGQNGHASSNGIRTTFFDAYGIAKTMDPATTYAEFSVNGGYLVAPEGAVAVNVAMWTGSNAWELYLLDRDHRYVGGVCTGCGAEDPIAHSYTKSVTQPTVTQQGYTTYTCTACGDSYKSDYVPATGKVTLANGLLTIEGSGLVSGFDFGAEELASVIALDVSLGLDFAEGVLESLTALETIHGYPNSDAGAYARANGLELKIKTLRVLLIGNSHTMNYSSHLTKILKDMAKAGMETTIAIDTATTGSIGLYSGRNSNANATYRSHLEGLNMNSGAYTKLSGKEYDLIVVQDYLESMIDTPEAFAAGLSTFLTRVEEIVAKNGHGTPQIAWFADWVDVRNTGGDSAVRDHTGASIKLDKLSREEVYAKSLASIAAVERAIAQGAAHMPDFVIQGSTIKQNAMSSYFGTTKNYAAPKYCLLESDTTHLTELGCYVLGAGVLASIADFYGSSLTAGDENVDVSTALSLANRPSSGMDAATLAVVREAAGNFGSFVPSAYTVDPITLAEKTILETKWNLAGAVDAATAADAIGNVIREKLGAVTALSVKVNEFTDPETFRAVVTLTMGYSKKDIAVEAFSHKHSYTTAVTQPTAAERGYTTYTCACGDSYVGDYVAARGYDWMLDDGTFRILFIGNSLTGDAAHAQTAKAIQAMVGEDVEVCVGVIISGGKTMTWHATEAERNEAVYSFTTYNGAGKATGHGTVSSSQALRFMDWDAVSIQPYVQEARTGMGAARYPEGEDEKFYPMKDSAAYLLDHVDKYAPNAEVYYYMIFANTSAQKFDAGRADYNAISGFAPTVLTYRGTESGNRFSDIVPVGTSIQNARSTYLAYLNFNRDKTVNTTNDPQIGLQRDATHVSFHIGRYIAGLTFAETVVPESLRTTSYTLPAISDSAAVGKLPAEYTAIAQAAVAAAMKSAALEGEARYGVTTMEGYRTDPIEQAKALAGTVITGGCIVDEETISRAILAKLPKDFSVDSVAVEGDSCTAVIRFGYSSAEVSLRYESGEHVYAPTVTAPTCTEQGYTTYTCACGDSYKADYAEPVWHAYDNGRCNMCGDEMLRVSLADIVRYQGGVNSADGTLNTTFTNNWYADIQIPDGAEQVRFLIFKTGGNWGSAFLNGNTYLSGTCDTTSGGYWMTVDVPEEATTFRYGYLYDSVAANAGYPAFEYLEFVGEDLTVQESSGFMDRPATGCHAFSVKVNIAPAQGNPTGYVEGTDYGYIQLPTSYTSYGEPTRLIIVCHGAGANLGTYQSDAWKNTNYSYWTELGYAVMDMYASPTELAGDTNGLHYGSPVVVDCYKEGYDYVMDHFNLKQDGIFLIGASMGGLSSFQIAQSGEFPVIAQVGYCPAIDLFKQAYVNPWTTASYQRSQIAKYFDFDGTAPAFTNSRYPSAAEIAYYKDNFSKTVPYSPIFSNVVSGDLEKIFDVIPSSATATSAAEEVLYQQLTATHPNPLMIFHNTDDSTVSYRYSKYFVDMVNRSGQEAILRTFTSGGHNAWANGASHTVQGLNGSITIKESQYEAYLFFKKYEEHASHIGWIDPAAAPTCTATGLTQGSHCAVCGEILLKQETVPATDHSFGTWSQTTAPTCTEKGQERRDCTNCEHYETRAVNALGHSWDGGKITTQPTCTKEGVKTYTCKNDASHTKTEAVAKLGHTAGTAVRENEVAASCTKTGSYDSVVYCSACKTELSRVKQTVPVTAHKDANGDYVCDVCQTKLCTSHVPVTVPGTAATCDKAGLTDGSKCGKCGTVLAAQQSIPAKGHSWDGGKVTTQPTCTKEGVKTYTCKHDATHTKTEAVAKLGHTPVTVPGTAATCDKAGLTDGSKCGKCGTVLTAQQSIPAKGHSWDGGKVTTQPTCTKEGVKTYTCKNDASHTKTEAVAKVNHTAGTAVRENEIAASCTKTGSYDSVVYCSACKTELSRVKQTVPVTVHKDANGDYVCDVCQTKLCTSHVPVTVPGTAATCDKAGLTDGSKCGKCGTVLTAQQSIPAKGHSFGAWSQTTAPTCTEKGQERRDCTNCEHYETRAVNALGHSWDDGKVTTAPTCTKEGVKTYTCKNDASHTKTENVAKISHTTGSEWKYDSSRHWHECTVCSTKLDTAAHKAGPAATATAPQTCKVCGYVMAPATGGEEEDEGGAGGGGGGGGGGGMALAPDEVDEEIIVGKDGSMQVIKIQGDGTNGTTDIAPNGVGKADIALTSPTVNRAQKAGEAVELPMAALVATADPANTSQVYIKVPGSFRNKDIRVELRVKSATAGTVAVLVHEDGRETVIPTTAQVNGGLVVSIRGNTTLKLLDKSVNFIDVVPGSTFDSYIDFVSARGLFNGTTANTFEPNVRTSRGQVMTVLARLAGADTSGAAIQKGMAWAVEQGISDGSNPGGAITRQQLATMLWRYAGEPKSGYVLSGHTDAHQISDYATTAMAWCLENGILTGYADGTLKPQNNATRAHVAAMIARYVNHIGG